MSAKTIGAPPQTYSRLFRPWDGTGKMPDSRFGKFLVRRAQDDQVGVSDSESEHTVKSEPMDYSPLKLVVPEDLVSDPTRLLANASEQLCNPMGAADLAAYYHYCYSQQQKLATAGIELLPPAMAAFGGLSGAGVDPLFATYEQMEQEYFRVLSEDAKAKLLASRKQRPKKFKCPHCDVAFSNNGQLKGHIRIHTGERPFKCDESTCGKTFTRNEELTRHKRIHTGIRPYGCPTCGKKFGRRDHLKKHTKTHMPQERYTYGLAPAAMLMGPMYTAPHVFGY